MGLEKLMDLCHKIVNNKFNVGYEDIIIGNYGEMTEIFCMNKSHTALFKILVKNSDLGIQFKHFCQVKIKDITNNKWRIRRDDSYKIPQSNFYGQDFFNELANANYYIVNYETLEKLKGYIRVVDNNVHNIYNEQFVKSCFLSDKIENVKMKMIGCDAPLIINYKYKIFDVYCLIAPIMTIKSDSTLKIFRSDVNG